MIAYWKAVASRLSGAAFDVIFVALFSLAPLLLGRLSFVINERVASSQYWLFLYNGQLAFFSMGSLATLLLLCFRKKLPNNATLWIGLLSCGCMFFLVALVAIDPTLQKGQSFVGNSALYLYIGVLIARILADAIKTVGAGDALQAGDAVTKNIRNKLSERMMGAEQ